MKNVRFKNFTFKEVGELLEVIEIESANISLKVGTPFIASTISLVVFLSSIIPIIYGKTDNRNGKLFYRIEPNFNKFEFVGEIQIDAKSTLLKVVWVRNYFKNKDNKQIKRRKKYEQSSYRGFDEYSYE